ILPDNDEPGHKHAHQVARSLLGVAASVSILELPGLPPKGDIVDWKAAGGTKEAFLQLLHQAVPFQKEATQEATAHQPPVPAYKPGFITSAEFDGANYSLEWLVKNVVVKGQPLIIGGPKKALKTSMVVDLAVSVAGGRKFLGEFFTPEPCRVAVLSGESGEATLQSTARRVAAAKGLRLADLNIL